MGYRTLCILSVNTPGGEALSRAAIRHVVSPGRTTRHLHTHQTLMPRRHRCGLHMHSTSKSNKYLANCILSLSTSIAYFHRTIAMTVEVVVHKT